MSRTNAVARKAVALEKLVTRLAEIYTEMKFTEPFVRIVRTPEDALAENRRVALARVRRILRTDDKKEAKALHYVLSDRRDSWFAELRQTAGYKNRHKIVVKIVEVRRLIFAVEQLMERLFKRDPLLMRPPSKALKQEIKLRIVKDPQLNSLFTGKEKDEIHGYYLVVNN